MSTMTETTISDMKAGFPPLPEPIQGIPTLQSLIELLFHLCCCAQTQMFDGTVDGLVVLVTKTMLNG
jgi:hypothetical protein